MSTSSEHAARKRANELYWTTDRPVRAIADEVGMSRSAVYSAIEPLGCGVTSPDADVELVFKTRTDRDERRATCPSTGKEHALDELPEAPIDPAKVGAGRERAAPAPRPATSVPAIDPEKLVLGAGIAAVGIGIGFAIARLLGEE